jgi:hypothetical protein
MRVKVANGGLMQCDTELVACDWCTQGVSFQTNFKVLPLVSYDVILGFDWLKQHSPMNIDWRRQAMDFDLDGRRVYLSGAQPDMSNCQPVSPEQLQILIQQARVARVVQLCLMQSPVDK